MNFIQHCVNEGIERFGFTSIEIDLYVKYARESSSAIEYASRIIEHHRSLDENIDASEILDFAEYVMGFINHARNFYLSE